MVAAGGEREIAGLSPEREAALEALLFVEEELGLLPWPCG